MVKKVSAELVGERVRVPARINSKARGRRVHRPCPASLGAAKQEFRDDADINRILARYRETGVLSQARETPVFGIDVGFKSYAEAHEILDRAKEQFLKLPPEIRLELGNDPGRYAELASEDGVKKVLERINKKELRRIAQAEALLASRKPKTPPQPAGPPVVENPERAATKTKSKE